MQFQVDFGAAQSGVGYQFFDPSGVIGSRITAGITNPRTGVYTATDTAGAGAIGIYWDSADPDFTAQEDLVERLIVEPRVDVAISTRAVAGDAMTLTSGERTSIGTAVWASATRTLSSFGTLVADIWASVARTLTDKTDFALTSAYDAAKTAMQDGGNANIQKINGVTITGDGQPGTEFGV